MPTTATRDGTLQDLGFRPALELTQPPVQGVPGVTSPRIRWPEDEVAHSLLTSAELKNEWSFTAIRSTLAE
jgi:hypothetical protein